MVALTSRQYRLLRIGIREGQQALAGPRRLLRLLLWQ